MGCAPSDTGQTRDFLPASSGSGPCLAGFLLSDRAGLGAELLLHSPCPHALPQGHLLHDGGSWGEPYKLREGTLEGLFENGKKTEDTGGPPGGELLPWSLST